MNRIFPVEFSLFSLLATGLITLLVGCETSVPLTATSTPVGAAYPRMSATPYAVDAPYQPFGSPTATSTPVGAVYPRMSATPCAVDVPYRSFVSPTATSTPVWAVCPQMPATPYVVDALYQSFEHGFMIWRSDENCVYALESGSHAIIPAEIPGDATFHAYSYCLTVAPLTGVGKLVTPPSGLLLPTGVLGKVWGSYAEIQEELGYALQPETSYMATIPVMELEYYDGLPFYIPHMSLPGGIILVCGSRGASATRCWPESGLRIRH